MVGESIKYDYLVLTHLSERPPRVELHRALRGEPKTVCGQSREPFRRLEDEWGGSVPFLLCQDCA
jgi:hypothetical protein